MSTSDVDRPRGPGRPPVASAHEAEAAALALLLERGYDTVSVADLANAAGMSRATYFRYFHSKAGVVWMGFDRAIDVMADHLAQAGPTSDVVGTIDAAIAASVRGTVDTEGAWHDRFLLLDTVPSLRAEGADRWERWSTTISTFVSERTGRPDGDAVAAAVAGAYRSAYVAVLRSWPRQQVGPGRLETVMLETFSALGSGLREMLDAP